jgi:hypothetical protein
MAVAQQLADFGQGSAATQHLAGQGVSKLMGALVRGINPSAF